MRFFSFENNSTMQKTLLFLLFILAASTSMLAQCFLDRHNTTWYDGWISCTPSLNPNPTRGESHWILYNLNYPYELFQLHIWNTNAPDYWADGMQDIAIDISNDGVSWTEVGEFRLPMADATPTYEGIDLFDFDGTVAQYVLITGLTNHGGNCYGLSEIRIDVADEVVVADREPVKPACMTARVFPNPLNAASKAIISDLCSFAPITYSIEDVSGRTIQSGQLTPTAREVEVNLEASALTAGSYILSLQQLGAVRRLKIIKVD
jgi:hypothetical protein